MASMSEKDGIDFKWNMNLKSCDPTLSDRGGKVLVSEICKFGDSANGQIYIILYSIYQVWTGCVLANYCLIDCRGRESWDIMS